MNVPDGHVFTFRSYLNGNVASRFARIESVFPFPLSPRSVPFFGVQSPTLSPSPSLYFQHGDNEGINSQVCDGGGSAGGFGWRSKGRVERWKETSAIGREAFRRRFDFVHQFWVALEFWRDWCYEEHN